MRVRAQLEYLGAAVGPRSPRGRAPASSAGWRGSGSQSAATTGWTRCRTATSSACSSRRRSCTTRSLSSSTSRSPGLDPLGVEALSAVIARARARRHGGAVLQPPARPRRARLRGRRRHRPRARGACRASSSACAPLPDRRYLTVGFRGTRPLDAGARDARVVAAEPGRTRLELTDGADLEALVRLARSAGDRDALQPRAAGAVGPVPRGGRAMTPARRSISSSRRARSPSAREAAPSRSPRSRSSPSSSPASIVPGARVTRPRALRAGITRRRRRPRSTDALRDAAARRRCTARAAPLSERRRRRGGRRATATPTC